MACSASVTDADAFGGGGLEGRARAAWGGGDGANQILTDDVAVLADNGFATNTAAAEVTVTATDLSTSDSFFESVNYIGAVSDQDTDSSWYKWVEAAVTAANAD